MFFHLPRLEVDQESFMKRVQIILRIMLRYGVAVLLICGAAALRLWPLQSLGTRLTWLTFYPTVMVAAIYGGVSAGLLAAVLACIIAVYFWPLISVQPYIREPADWLGMAVFFLTCTMISILAESMRRANDRARKAQVQAEASNQAKSIFLANMSHELRTPLNAILGFSNLMRSDAALSTDHRQTLDIINRSGEHLLNLINDILDMAKVEAGRIDIENAPFDMNEMINDITDLMRVRAEEKGLQLLVDETSSFPRFLLADGAKLRQVLINLIGNAIKYTRQGQVNLRLNTRSGRTPPDLLLIIAVEDSGAGIAPEDQPRIFEPFVQVGKQTTHKGTGLGLAITRKVVELMGGTIRVESVVGRGSIFRLEIPVGQAEEAEMRSVKISRGRVVSLAAGQPEIRLLIVEDQMENWLLLKRLLENAGLQVRVAENGALGIEAFQQWQPNLIWMDIRMPVMDGLEATRRIRSLNGGRDVKIVALSASVLKEEHENILAAGMDDFIHKPYRAEEIFECLVRQLGLTFIYEEDASASTLKMSMTMLPEALAKLPPELSRELTDALVSLDGERIAEIIRRITETNPDSGDLLAQFTSQLSYSTILSALQAGKE
jgi:signal transduction histidine kinase/DNA-binding NarL/FixJ family response regulator